MSGGNQRSKIRLIREVPWIATTPNDRQASRIDENVQIIHSIYRGPSLNGKLNNSRKRYAIEECNDIDTEMYILQRKI